MRTLKDLFLDELADRYDSEKRLVIAMPKMIKAATCPRLRSLIETHLMETERQVAKLEKVFKLFGEKPSVNKCDATIGILAEGTEVSSDNKGSVVINAALVSVAQKIEHYEIASYGCLREWATLLGNKPAAMLLKEILDEEKAANQALIKLARAHCNNQALNARGDDDSCVTDKKMKPVKRAA
ncbi:MAG TPA: ferritin-like domain-containing protein [Opitutales bacterium]|jgi:ferritin-like metal-binding protein YciE|nr:ferritin-like domain-containing protein [Opitutales bacterium]